VKCNDWIQVGHFNSTGQKYPYHFDPWLINELEETKTLVTQFVPDITHWTGWVNGNLYQPTTETFGIVPVPPDVLVATSMEKYDQSLDLKQQHAYLAQKQGTRKAVLPIHTEAEYRLFSYFMRDPTLFTKSNDSPNWHILVKTWNCKANEEPLIFYKVSNHIYMTSLIHNLNAS
jgi:hypothetical protein